jgi:hypothetical protein
VLLSSPSQAAAAIEILAANHADQFAALSLAVHSLFAALSLAAHSHAAHSLAAHNHADQLALQLATNWLDN